ncbi:MAG: hypothetical protein ACR2LV_05530 [Solirubrobacteraceae bacterium]
MLPAPVDAVALLALLTRVRAARVVAGELSPGREHDVRAFKCCVAELAYLRRLAAGGRHGGTVVTSMRQLVAGLAVLHPAWRITGEGFEDRDRHHRAVRRRLRDLEAMGLLCWRVGVDLDGEERRTELELLPAPELSVEELQGAAGHLARWQARYGHSLNTGSATEILDAVRHGRPLSASERQRRGVQHARARAAVRCCREHRSNSAPPCGAPLSAENNSPVTPTASELRHASHKTGVTRTHAVKTPNVDATLDTPKTTTGQERGTDQRNDPPSPNATVDESQPAEGPVIDVQALLVRVKTREVQRAPVLELIAAQASARAVELAGWGLERTWPFSRLREAWVVARYGPMAGAESGPSGAGPLGPEDYARLRRAVARYERNASAAPEGYPAGGLAGLLHLGTLAGTGGLVGGPRMLAYAIGALDQLSRRMRAVATAGSAVRLAAATERARCRRQDPPPRALQLVFRASKWPGWVRTGPDGEPVFDAGLLVLDVEHPGLPPVGSDGYRMVLRDAYLLAGLQPPLRVDGRATMALRYRGQIEPAERRASRTLGELALTELARRTGEPPALLRRLSVGYRQAWLARQRQGDAERARREMTALRERIHEIHDRRSGASEPRDA